MQIDKEILVKIVHPDTLKAYEDAGEIYRPETKERTRYIFFERTGILTDRFGKKINEIQRVVNAIYRVRNTKERRTPTDNQEFLLYNLHDSLDDLQGNRITWSKEMDGMHKVPIFQMDYGQDNKLHVTGISSEKWFYDIRYSKEEVDKLLELQKQDAAGARLYFGYIEDGKVKNVVGGLTYEEFTHEDFDEVYKMIMAREVKQQVVISQPPAWQLQQQQQQQQQKTNS